MEVVNNQKPLPILGERQPSRYISRSVLHGCCHAVHSVQSDLVCKDPPRHIVKRCLDSAPGGAIYPEDGCVLVLLYLRKLQSKLRLADALDPMNEHNTARDFVGGRWLQELLDLGQLEGPSHEMGFGSPWCKGQFEVI